MALTYAPPAVIVQSLGAQNPILSGPAARTIMVLGTAPQGPDYPVLLSPAQAVTVFGDPAAASTTGYSIPYLLSFAATQRQSPGVSNPLQFLVCRAGVTRATYAVLDGSSGTTMTLAGVGAYAGTAGSQLRIDIGVNSGAVKNVILRDVRTNAVVMQLLDVSTGGTYDLSSNAKIVAAINGANPLTSINAVVRATLGGSALVPAAVSSVAPTGGVDGKGAAYNDTTIGTVGSGGLLDQSLWAHADYIIAGWDANLLLNVSGGLLGHVSTTVAGTALAQNQFRILRLGAVAGTTFSSLSGSYMASMTNDRIAVEAHDAFYGYHPALGTSNYLWDGFYLAAAGAGLEASGGPEQTCVGMPVSGVSSIALPPDKTNVLTSADQNTLAGKGLRVWEQPAGQATPTIRDNITAAPYQSPTTGGINPFYQANVRSIDDAVSTALVRYIAPYKGQPRSSVQEQNGLMQAAAYNALSSVGPSINGVNAVTVTTDPRTLVTTVAVSYVTRFPLTQLVIQTSFSFLPLTATS